MKLHIDKEQLKMLSAAGKRAYSEWRVGKNNIMFSGEYWHSLPTIGQMIKYCRENDIYFCVDSDKPAEPIDTLWEVVREHLNARTNRSIKS